MADPHDELETWLSAKVRPLPPPPGAFERIRVRARRRRVRRAVLTAASGLVLAATGAVVIPQVVIPALEAGPATITAGRGHRPAASAANPATAGHTPGSTMTGGTPASLVAPPALSVTFVGANTGWVMGQAIPPQQCDLATAPPCIRLARTDTAGASWAPVKPPPAHGPAGPTGVSQIRFLDTSNGWAFGPQLWATHDGGRTWTRTGTGGLRVTALETRGNRVFAVWARCTGSGADFAAHCGRFTLYSAAASGGPWAPVPGGSVSPSPAGASGSVALVLNGTSAYLLAPDGVLLAGPLTGTGLQQVTSIIPPPTAAPGTTPPAVPRLAPCQPGPAQPGGPPAGALLATNASGLGLVCTGAAASGGNQAKAVYTSQDGGLTWQPAGQAAAAGTASCLSGSPTGTLLLATSLGIAISTSGGRTWAPAKVTAPPAGGFAYLGMTNRSQGVAVPADPGQHAIWFTYDGGQSWAPAPTGI